MNAEEEHMCGSQGMTVRTQGARIECFNLSFGGFVHGIGCFRETVHNKSRFGA